ncbi:MAG: Rrf2 family transcriptional regulator [Myxococcales bacterium]|nr:Rrf2 family transcriptional regulator [Myxococcales bacterium]
MQLKKETYYALRGLRFLLRHPRGTVFQISRIANAEGVPEASLSKVFRRMASAGILQTHRGVGGGTSLARDPEQTSLRDVVEAVEGPLPLQGCPLASLTCDAGQKCSVFQAVCRTQRAWLNALETEKITGLCRTPAASRTRGRARR